MTDMAGLFVKIEVLQGEAGGRGTVAISSTPGLRAAVIVWLLRHVADNLEEDEEDVA